MASAEHEPITGVWGLCHQRGPGDIKEDWGSGGRKSPSGVQGQSPGRGSGGRCPPEAEAFFVNYT